MIIATENGSVELYHDNVKALSTTSTGAAIYGRSGNGIFDIVPTGSAAYSILNFYNVGQSNNAQIIAVYGQAIYVGSGGTGDVVLRTGNTQNKVRCVHNGQVELFYNTTKMFETISGGAKITGGDGNGLQIENGGTNLAAQFKLKNTTVNKQYTLGVAGNTGANGQNSSLVFRDETANTTRLEINTSGHLLPGQNNTYDLGATGRRWANIYTNDLHLSNIGHTNDVDGTWGDWTIQEGESDLFLKNNRSGKKYKFNLTEVS